MVVSAVKVPLDDSGAILPRILANVQRLSAESENDVFSTMWTDFLKPILLVPLIVGWLFKDYCSILI